MRIIISLWLFSLLFFNCSEITQPEEKEDVPVITPIETVKVVPDPIGLTVTTEYSNKVMLLWSMKDSSLWKKSIDSTYYIYFSDSSNKYTDSSIFVFKGVWALAAIYQPANTTKYYWVRAYKVVDGKNVFSNLVGPVKATTLDLNSIVETTYYTITKVNSANLITINIQAKSTSQKEIKYIYWNVAVLNAVGDIVPEEIDRDIYKSCRLTGPIKMNVSYSGSWELGYYDEHSRLKVIVNRIDFMDRTTRYQF